MSENNGDSDSNLYSLSNDRAQDEILLQPFNHMAQKGGKNVRKKLLEAFNHWMNVEEKKVVEIGEIIQMLHNASLILDDIEDSSILRRGIPCSHKIFGIPMTINAGNYVMFIALERLIGLGHSEAVKVFNEHMLELHRGQGMEIYWRDNVKCPTEDEYKQMTIRKTGGLFNLAVKLMELFSKNSDKEKGEDYVALTSLLGLYFQIRDDYANLCLEEYTANKSFAEDLTEGKFSFPIIYAIQKSPEDSKVLSILRQRTTDVDVKKYCVELLRDMGAFSYTKNCMLELDKKVREEIQKLGGNEKLIALMDYLKNWD